MRKKRLNTALLATGKATLNQSFGFALVFKFVNMNILNRILLSHAALILIYP